MNLLLPRGSKIAEKPRNDWPGGKGEADPPKGHLELEGGKRKWVQPERQGDCSSGRGKNQGVSERDSLGGATPVGHRRKKGAAVEGADLTA